MALSNSALLEELKTARDVIVAGLAAGGESLISYTIRGRVVQVMPSISVLEKLETMIKTYEGKSNSRRRWKLGTFSPPGGRG